MRILLTLSLFFLSIFTHFGQNLSKEELLGYVQKYYYTNYNKICNDCIESEFGYSYGDIEQLKIFNFKDGGFVIFFQQIILLMPF